jgi:hypothetical protein
MDDPICMLTVSRLTVYVIGSTVARTNNVEPCSCIQCNVCGQHSSSTPEAGLPINAIHASVTDTNAATLAADEA